MLSKPRKHKTPTQKTTPKDLKTITDELGEVGLRSLEKHVAKDIEELKRTNRYLD